MFEPEVSSIKAAIERVLIDSNMYTIARQIAEEMASATSLGDAVDELLIPLKI